MPAHKTLSTADIDDLCDRFEEQCKAGVAPRIEDCLTGLADDDREQLLRELLYIEHQHRLRASDAHDGETYYQRFPNHTYIIDEVLNHGLGNDCRTLLSADGSLLEALPAEDDADATGGTLGDYELLGELGRGGMGIVYRAKQKSVGRIVALKILRRDTLRELGEDQQKMMIERFRTESQSAAQLQHDHIVPVFEVGQADGVHFYSMRYVEGESLAELIAAQPLDNSTAAQAIEPVARALAAAHEHGVLHRDIKPRNIMIDDATGRPMLTDFGLAKLVDNDSDMTHTGDVMGSPPYMSPEQATDAAHVTAAADIYSLGATMYHTLTGRAPFQAATIAETLRQVWFEEPPAPRSLNTAIDQDLETICLKCLEKEPARRFESAAELADELARYLRGEPILSRPVGTLGQLQRWRRRNPAVANLVGVVALLLLLGLFGATYYSIRLQRSLTDARERLDLAVGAVDKYTDIATREDGLKAHGVDEVRREMLNASRQYYDRFVQRESNDPQLETERGKAYGRLANIEADLGDQIEATRLYSQAVEVFAGLEKRFPKQPRYTYLRAAYLTNLAGLYRDFGQLNEAETTLTAAYRLASDLHDAHPSSVEFAALLGQIHNERGVVYMDLGKTEEAERARLETVNLWNQIVAVDDTAENQHQLATSHNNLAEFYRSNQQQDQASENFNQAIAIWESLVSDHLLISEYTAGLAMCQYNFGMMQLEAGDDELAEPLLMAALGQRYHLAEKHRQLPEYRDDLATSLDSMGRLLQLRGEYARAAGEMREALAIREELRNRFVDVAKYEVAYAASQMNLGQLYKIDGRWAEATGYFRIAIDVLNRIVAENPQVAAYREHLTGAHYNLALVLLNLANTHAGHGELHAAEAAISQAAETLQQVPTADADAPLIQELLAIALEAQAELRGEIDPRQAIVRPPLP